MSSKTLAMACAVAFMAAVAAPQAEAGLPWSKKNKDAAAEGEAKAATAEGDIRKVTGRNGVEGEIMGTAKAGSAFNKLEIGMPQKQVSDLLGGGVQADADCGSYATGKAWIPYHFGGDKYRTECAYKGLGRLIFTSQSDFDSRSVLLKIVHDASEDGYR